MNYAAHYERLIARARDRDLAGYRERHHVKPRCLGGGDEPQNLVYLTGEEHYVAHQLLVRMNPGHAGLIYAAMFMSKQATGNKAFGWLRRRYSQAMHGTKRCLGNKHSLEARAKMSASRKGSTFPNRKRGVIFTPEHRAKLSASRLGKKRPPEVGARIAAAQRGKVISAATRAKMSVSRRKRITSPETRAKMSATHRGKQGKSPSPEARAKIAATLRARWDAGYGRNQWSPK